MKTALITGWVRIDMGGSSAPRSVEEGADTIVWLAAEASHNMWSLGRRYQLIQPYIRAMNNGTSQSHMMMKKGTLRKIETATKSRRWPLLRAPMQSDTTPNRMKAIVASTQIAPKG